MRLELSDLDLASNLGSSAEIKNDKKEPTDEHRSKILQRETQLIE